MQSLHTHTREGFLKLLRSPGIDSLELIPPGFVASVGNLSPAMGSRNQVGIGLSYRPASLCSLATQFQTRFLESIPRTIAGLKFPNLCWNFELWRAGPTTLFLLGFLPPNIVPKIPALNRFQPRLHHFLLSFVLPSTISPTNYIHIYLEYHSV